MPKMLLGGISVLLFSLTFALQPSVSVMARGGEVDCDTSLYYGDGACDSQPGQNCLQEWNKCTTGTARGCDEGGGDNGCGSQTVCVPHDNDKKISCGS